MNSKGHLNSNESQFSIFYTTYNLDSYDSSSSNSSELTDVLKSFESGSTNLLKFLFLGIGISIVASLGIIGNGLSILVLSNVRMRSSISCFLIGLSICDTVLLINALLAYGLPTILSYTKSVHLFGEVSPFLRFGHLTQFVFGLSVTSITGSVYFTLAVTLERYFAVCKPFFARRICTWRRACQFSVGIVLVAICYNLPRWFEYTCVTAYANGDDNQVVIGCRPIPTPLRTNLVYDLYYANILYLIVHYIFPICCLIIINVLIYLKIREANNNRKILSVSESKEKSLAYMLFIVVAVFLCCNSVPPIHTIWRYVTKNNPIPQVEVIRTFLLVFNSSVNFVIYCAYGERFREVFLDIVCPRRRLERLRHGSDSSDCSPKLETSVIHKMFNFQASIKTICEEV